MHAGLAPSGNSRFLMPGCFILRHPNHTADSSLFFLNLRANAQARA